MTDYIRGQTIRFSTVFKDFGGVVTDPGSAKTRVHYRTLTGTVATVEIEMAQDGDTWRALWDTRQTAPGLFFWAIYPTGGSLPYGLDQGFANLVANAANPTTFP